MVHHLSLLRVKEDATSELLDKLIVEIRIRLLKLPEVSNLRVGKRIDVKQNPYQLFYLFDVENMEKLRFIQDSAIYVQFQRQILEIYVIESKSLDYEMEPGKDVTYS